MEMFESVKESYTRGEAVTIMESSKEHEGKHCVKLENFVIPELRVVLARQRKDYNISEDFQWKIKLLMLTTHL